MTYASVSTQDAQEHRNMRYAMKFVNDSNDEATDANLATVLASCGRAPKPAEYPFIRRHVQTFRDGRAKEREIVKAELLERAESYSRDAHKFAAMPESGQTTEALTEEDCKRYAVMYWTITDELRKVAASL